MGNTPICCNYKEKDQFAQEYDKTDNKGIRKADVAAPEANNKQALEDLMTTAKENEVKIVKMQARVRGFLQRKVNKKANDVCDPKP